MSRVTALALQLYRWLARAFPEDFLRLYGQDMVIAGEDEIRVVAARRGLRGVVTLTFHLLFDIARRLPAEHLSEFLSDVRHSIRVLARSKATVLAVALSTGLAIAISLGTYNEMSIVFHAVPGIGEPNGLVGIQTPMSYSDFERYADPGGPFAAATAYRGPVALSIRHEGITERVFGHIVTPNYFEVLKTGATLGRTFVGDPSTGNADVIVSEGYRQRHFSGSHDVIGKTLILNGQSATIIGVATKEFIGASPLTSAAEIWLSTTAAPRIASELAPSLLHDPYQADFHLLGRLKPGVTPAQAENQLDIIAKELQREKGDTPRVANQSRLITVLPGGQLIPIRRRDLPTVLAAPVMLEALLLLLACTNASTLLLAKAGARRREITIRTALGASRRRMIKQLLTESISLAISGGVVGLALALFLNHQSQKAISNVFPSYIHLDLSMGWPSAALAFGISVISGIVFGVVPAFNATRVDLLSGLKAGYGGFLPGYRWLSSRNALVALQVASSTAVIILVGIIGLGYQRASNTADFGFEPRHLYTFSIDPLREGYSAERAWEFLKTLPDKLSQIPDVRQASIAENPPIGDLAARTMAPRLASTASSEPAYVRSENGRRTLRPVSAEYVGTAYFETLSVKPLRGRVFTVQDRPESFESIVINATLAEEAWPSEDPIGRQLEIGSRVYDVIGVVNDFRSDLLTSPVPEAFHLLGPEQIAKPALQGMTVIVRSAPGSDVRDKFKAEIARIDPNVTVFNIASQNDRLNEALFLNRIQTMSYGVIGLCGLMLAAVGLAGVTAYAVAQRTKEIGIRVALGATRFQILRVVCGEGATLVIAGILAGQAGAVALIAILNAWYVRLYEITRTSSGDPIILFAAPLLLAAVTMISCFVPARRALRIHPVFALRHE